MFASSGGSLKLFSLALTQKKLLVRETPVTENEANTVRANMMIFYRFHFHCFIAQFHFQSNEKKWHSRTETEIFAGKTSDVAHNEWQVNFHIDNDILMVLKNYPYAHFKLNFVRFMSYRLQCSSSILIKRSTEWNKIMFSVGTHSPAHGMTKTTYNTSTRTAWYTVTYVQIMYK